MATASTASTSAAKLTAQEEYDDFFKDFPDLEGEVRRLSLQRRMQKGLEAEITSRKQDSHAESQHTVTRPLPLHDRRYHGALRVADKLGEPGSPARAAYLERWRLERLGVLHPCMPLPKPIE